MRLTAAVTTATCLFLGGGAFQTLRAAEEIEFAGPDWKPGETLRVEVRKERSRTEPGKPLRIGGSRSIIRLGVSEVLAGGGYVLLAVYEQIIPFVDRELTLPAQSATQSLVDALRDIQLEIELDAAYEPARIRNLTQVRPQLVTLFRALDSSDAGVQAAQAMERLFQNDQVVTALLLRELKPFFGLMGSRFELGEGKPTPVEIPNPVGSGAITAVSKLIATASGSPPRSVQVQLEYRPDPASLTKMAEHVVRAAGVDVPPGKLEEVFRSASFVERTVYELREDMAGVPDLVTHARDISVGPLTSREVTTLKLLKR